MPVSHACQGMIFHAFTRINDDTVAILKKRLIRNAGIACADAVSGLTRSSTIISEVTERRAESEMPKRREFIDVGGRG